MNKISCKLKANLLISFFCIVFCAAFISCATNQKKVNISNEAFIIKRGINISHWLSQTTLNNPTQSLIFSERDVKLIVHFGFDHIRLPVDEELLWYKNGKKRNQSFQMLHDAMHWCIKNNLRVILDLHQTNSHSFSNSDNLLWHSKAEQNRFVQIWKELSLEFSGYPNYLLAYELLNEPVADDPDDWNKLLKRTIDTLRNYEAERKIIIGSNQWQSPETFKDLVIPGNDSNIIASFHFYEPFIFTHYKADWSEFKDYTGPVIYPGQTISEEYLKNYDEDLKQKLNKFTKYYNVDSLLTLLKEPLEFSKRYNIDLYCGEFGCIPKVNRSGRLKWYNDVRELFEENNIAWSSWDYKGAFSITSLNNEITDNKLIEVLTGSLIKN